MRAKRIGRDEQIRLIMECRGSGLSDYQWCEANGVLPGTFYMWISRLRKAGYTIPDPAKRQKAVPIIQDVVKLPVADSEINEVNRLSTSRILFFPNKYINGYKEFFKYVFTRFLSSAPFSPSGSVGYIFSSVIAPENGLAAHVSFTSNYV